MLCLSGFLRPFVERQGHNLRLHHLAANFDGNLGIEWRAAGPEAEHVFMTGEAVEVFKGEIEVGNDELVSAE